MIKIIVFLLFFALTQNSFGQSFEGKITYKFSCKSNMQNYSDEMVCGNAPKTQEYFIKGGNYKFTFSEHSTFEWMIYVNKENKIYNKLPSNDTLYWRNASENKDTILEIKTNKKVVTILGLQCDEVIFIYRDQIHKFYYNSNISVDRNIFKKHKFGNLYDFFEKSNSLVLKEILECEYFTLESVATEIKREKMDDAIFTLPSNSVLQKLVD